MKTSESEIPSSSKTAVIAMMLKELSSTIKMGEVLCSHSSLTLPIWFSSSPKRRGSVWWSPIWLWYLKMICGIYSIPTLPRVDWIGWFLSSKDLELDFYSSFSLSISIWILWGTFNLTEGDGPWVSIMKEKVEPWPRMEFSKQISPWNVSHMRLQIKRPKPIPFLFYYAVLLNFPNI